MRKTPFLIVGTYRTGSSAIGELLGLHPQILCGWETLHEVLFPKKISTAETFLAGDFRGLREQERKYVESTQTDDTVALGFRSLFRSSNKWLFRPAWAPALLADRMAGQLHWLKSRRPDIRVIHLIRTDNLAWLSSLAMAKGSGSFFGTEYPDALQVSLNLREAAKRVTTKHYIDTQLATLAQSNPYQRVIYEEFKADNSGSINRLVEFLGCNPALELIAQPKASVQSANRQADPLLNRIQLIESLRTKKLLRYDP